MLAVRKESRHQNCTYWLAGMEVTSSIAPPVVLCFAFVLVTHQCFGCYGIVLAQPQSLLFFPTYSEQAGVGKRLGQDTARTADPSRSKGYSVPYAVMLSNKNWRRRRKKWGALASNVAVALTLAEHWSACVRGLSDFLCLFFPLSITCQTVFIPTH